MLGKGFEHCHIKQFVYNNDVENFFVIFFKHGSCMYQYTHQYCSSIMILHVPELHFKLLGLYVPGQVKVCMVPVLSQYLEFRYRTSTGRYGKIAESMHLD